MQTDFMRMMGPWAMLPEALMEHRRRASSPLAASYAPVAAADAPPQRGGGIAIIPVRGMITPRSGMMTMLFGGTSTETLGLQVRAMVADDSIGTIVLDIDSPGGMVAGVTELAATLRAARAVKPLIAIANNMAASAAYWIGSQATEFVATPSAMVGSIGVLMEHEDDSGLLAQAGIAVTLISAGRYKTLGNPYEPLSDDARAEIQALVDGAYGMFVADVAAGRGVKANAVRSGYGEGRVLTPAAALEAGMVDRIATLAEVIDRLRPRGQAGRRRAALRLAELR